MLKPYLRDVHQNVRRRWRRARRRWMAPVLDEKQILDALRQLSPAPPGVLLVHSSLSACGRVRGGPPTVIQALRSWNAGGTLAMPAHSYCYPAGGAAGPVFDPTRTPSVVGAITEAFWKQSRAQRSLHPTHSLAAEGPAVNSLIAGHESCDTPCGRGTPYERLVQQDAAVLMFGVTMDTYTLFHTAEDAAAVPYLYEPRLVALRFRSTDGVEQVMAMRRHDMSVARSFQQKDGWLEERGLLRRVPLGHGELLLLKHSRRVHDALVAQLRHDPWFLATVSA